MSLFGDKKQFLIGAAIGSGSVALAAERGEVDFLLAINAGRMRSMGAASIASMLPIFNASAHTEDFARQEVLTQCTTPIYLGIGIWDKVFDPKTRAAQIRDFGFAGGVNFPSCMLYPRPMQQILARAGRGIEQEVEQLRALQDLGLSSMFYCATWMQARLAADAGLDMVCLNLGWNVGGALGHRGRISIEEVAVKTHEISRLIKRIHPAPKFLLEGGPIASANDLAAVSSLAPIDGYVGGSTIERMPLELSVAEQVNRFRQAGRRRSPLDEQSARLVSWGKRYGLVGRSKAQLGFLQRLHVLAAARNPVLLLLEEGMSASQVLSALSPSGRRGVGGNVIHIDLTGDILPAQVRAQMFGTKTDTAKQLPLLADSQVDMVAIHAPQRLSAGIQRQLFRAIRDEEFQMPGTRRVLKVVPRIALICQQAGGSKESTEALAAQGLIPEMAVFLEGWAVRPPPLRDRTHDLNVIIERMAKHIFGNRAKHLVFSSSALQALQAHLWPGNEAELHSILGKLAGRGEQTPAQGEEVVALLSEGTPTSQTPRTERERIIDALWRNGFSRTRTADALGLSRKTLYNKIKKFGLA